MSDCQLPDPPLPESAWVAEVKRLAARVAELEAALRPFAALATWQDVAGQQGLPPLPDRYALTYAIVSEHDAEDGGPMPCIGDCRRAAALLVGTPPEKPPS